MLQKFFLKQMLSKQLGALPRGEQEKILDAFEHNPQFFESLIGEISNRLKSGESQQAAIMSVLSTHRGELEKILKP